MLKISRLFALIRKESQQMWRDQSNMLVGLLLPIILILLFGYGLSFDVKNAPLAVLDLDRSPSVQKMLASFQGSEYLQPVAVNDLATATRWLNNGEVFGILQIPSDFSRSLNQGESKLQLLLNGVDSSTAQTVESYVNGALAQWQQSELARSGNLASASGITIVQRMWFNEANNSTWYLVPGVLVLVITLIGTFLTSLLIAREWERGTLESLFVTPVQPIEIMLAKIAPYLVIGVVDVVMCVVASRFLFDVPIRGSLVALFGSALLYLLVSLLLGLWISAATRNQFQASQMALVLSFMPAMMLSGFVFDLRNVPTVIQIISQLLPATHFMSLVKQQFLSGTDWLDVVKQNSILAFYALLLMWAVTRNLRKTLDEK